MVTWIHQSPIHPGPTILSNNICGDLPSVSYDWCSCYNLVPIACLDEGLFFLSRFSKFKQLTKDHIDIKPMKRPVSAHSNRRDFLAGNAKFLREINTGTILRIIRERQPISRVQIAGLTGLTKSTVSSIITISGLAVLFQQSRRARPRVTIPANGPLQ